MIKQLFPIKHVAGYISSLVLSAVALVVLLDMPATSKLAVLLITAILQATVQLMLFMHVGESDDKNPFTSTLPSLCSLALSRFSERCSSSYGAGMLNPANISEFAM